MTPERWQRIEDLFQSARTRATPAERAAFLDGACTGDADLRAEVESLLAADESAGSFINTSAVKIAAGAVADERVEAMLGKTVAHYRVIAPLGAGGMGEVYLASDTRTERKVALKLLPEYLTRDAERVGRFQQEARSPRAESSEHRHHLRDRRGRRRAVHRQRIHQRHDAAPAHV